VVLGRSTPIWAKFSLGETLLEMVVQDLLSGDEALKQLKYHLQK